MDITPDVIFKPRKDRNGCRLLARGRINVPVGVGVSVTGWEIQVGREDVNGIKNKQTNQDIYNSMVRTTCVPHKLQLFVAVWSWAKLSYLTSLGVTVIIIGWLENLGKVEHKYCLPSRWHRVASQQTAAHVISFVSVLITTTVLITTHLYVLHIMPLLSSPSLCWPPPPSQGIWNQHLSGSHPTLDPLSTHPLSLRPSPSFFLFPLPSHSCDWHSTPVEPQEQNSGESKITECWVFLPPCQDHVKNSYCT